MSLLIENWLFKSKRKRKTFSIHWPTKKTFLTSFHLLYYVHINKHIHTYTALGDPLIKGLTEVANTRPSNPVKFLADYLHSIADNKKIVIFCVPLHRLQVQCQCLVLIKRIVLRSIFCLFLLPERLSNRSATQRTGSTEKAGPITSITTKITTSITAGTKNGFVRI